MIQVELNGKAFRILFGTDLLDIDKQGVVEIHPGLYIPACTRWDDILAATGYRSGSFDWALPEEWARQHGTRVMRNGERIYERPQAIWCYQADKGCSPVFGDPVYLSAVLQELGERVAELLRERER